MSVYTYQGVRQLHLRQDALRVTLSLSFFSFFFFLHWPKNWEPESSDADGQDGQECVDTACPWHLGSSVLSTARCRNSLHYYPWSCSAKLSEHGRSRGWQRNLIHAFTKGKVSSRIRSTCSVLYFFGSWKPLRMEAVFFGWDGWPLGTAIQTSF